MRGTGAGEGISPHETTAASAAAEGPERDGTDRVAVSAARSRERTVGILLVIVSACGFGSGALFAKPVYGAGLDWLTLLSWRFLFAALLLWLWLLLRPADRAALRTLNRRRVALLVLLGLLYVGNSSTYFAALETVPASLAALIVYLYPALVAVLSLRFARPLEGRRAWLALGIATLGVAFAVGGIQADRVPPMLGLLLTVVSPLIYAVWIILAARLGGERATAPPHDAETAPDVDATAPAPAIAIMATATFAVFWVAAALTGRPVDPRQVPADAWVGLIGVGVVATALAMLTFYAGARRIGAAQASLVSTVEPVYTITLATLLFGETLTPIQFLGGALVLGGVVLAQTGRSARTGEASATVRRASEPTAAES
jgi:drug/metabolite transporter (DMT)-like permease